MNASHHIIPLLWEHLPVNGESLERRFKQLTALPQPGTKLESSQLESGFLELLETLAARFLGFIQHYAQGEEPSSNFQELRRCGFLTRDKERRQPG